MSSSQGNLKSWALAGRRLELLILIIGLAWVLFVGVSLARVVAASTLAFWIVVAFASMLPMTAAATVVLLKPRVRTPVVMAGVTGQVDEPPRFAYRLAPYFLFWVASLMIAFRLAQFALQRHASPLFILGILVLDVSMLGIYIIMNEVRIWRKRKSTLLRGVVGPNVPTGYPRSLTACSFTSS